MKKIIILLLFFGFPHPHSAQQNAKDQIDALLDKWHADAAKADFGAYFDAMDEQGIFIGTDATENWDKKAFQAFAKPYFDRGKAWNFTSLERHVYFSADAKTAWFDELLNTQMKICRGSGVLVKTKKGWKIRHYVLSMTVPNDNSDEVVKIKTALENPIIERLTK